MSRDHVGELASVRGSKSLRSTVQSRGGHISTGNHATKHKQAREAQFGATDRDRAMTLPIKSTKTAIRVVGEDVGASLHVQLALGTGVPTKRLRNAFFLLPNHTKRL